MQACWHACMLHCCNHMRNTKICIQIAACTAGFTHTASILDLPVLSLPIFLLAAPEIATACLPNDFDATCHISARALRGVCYKSGRRHISTTCMTARWLPHDCCMHIGCGVQGSWWLLGTHTCPKLSTLVELRLCSPFVCVVFN